MYSALHAEHDKVGEESISPRLRNGVGGLHMRKVESFVDATALDESTKCL